ncbi:hypothetical protein [Aureimonas sp. N4]|uniref:hypothetical protein n=1 Tax=Aureimonas sp. N4 TaxID=1638165 RepID=UPI000783FDDC|nr:hypothetical protein [Aureimonas sp. N4]
MRPIPPTPDRYDDPLNLPRGIIVGLISTAGIASLFCAALSLCNDFYGSSSAARQETTLGSSYRSAGVR